MCENDSNDPQKSPPERKGKWKFDQGSQVAPNN